MRLTESLMAAFDAANDSTYRPMRKELPNLMISGMQHVKPGGKVTPKLIPMPVMAETAQSPTSSPQVKAQEATSKSWQE